MHAVVARSTFPSQNVQNTPRSEHFCKLRCWEKALAIVARSAFRSQNAQNTPTSDRFWKLRCSKSVRTCGAKHISKSKVQNTDGYEALLDVKMLFRMAGASDCAPCQSEQNVKVF